MRLAGGMEIILCRRLFFAVGVPPDYDKSPLPPHDIPLAELFITPFIPNHSLDDYSTNLKKMKWIRKSLG